MGSLPPLTEMQHEAAIRRAAESLALTSGAGCGKTLVLARRFTELLMRTGGGEKNPFDRLVALTFTEKAASEMSGRVRTVLLEALADSRSDADRRRLAEWITELPAAHISTIHSFCSSLLRRHAIEAGVDPGFVVCADDLLSKQMLARSAEQTVLEAIEKRNSPVMELLARADLGSVIGDVRTLLDKRLAWDPADFENVEEILARWKELRDSARRGELERLADEKTLAELDYLASFPCGDASDRLLEYRQRTLAIIERIVKKPDSVTFGDVASLRLPGNLGGAKAWGGKEAKLAYRRSLAAFVKRFTDLADYFAPLGPDDEYAARCLRALTGLAGRAAEIYASRKQAAGMLDFDDLIDLTDRLLRENPAVRKALRNRLDQLLIDECQDVDALQLRMLWSLLTDGQQPPAGKVIVIGDPKQSIYRFRGAQVEQFNRLCESFGESRLPLTKSFRTHGAGVAFVNEVFSRLMGTGYGPIVSSRKELPDGPGVEILLARCQPDAASAASAQAELTAQRIEEMIGREKLVFDRGADTWRPVRPGDVAVLFARMTNTLEYERALARRSLPYYVVGGVGFFRQQEVYDVLNALRVVDNPFDDVALFGVLRSGMFGLDDNALLKIASSSEPPYFDKLTAPAVMERLTGPQSKQLRFAAGLLGRLNGAKDAMGTAAIIETLLERTGYSAVLLSEFHGRRKLGNVLRLLEAARSSESAGGLALADFVRRYNEFIVDESRCEQASVVGRDDDVVRVMTIHKAKGLEFPVVIAADLNAGFRGVDGRILLNPEWLLTYKPPGPDDETEDDGPSAGKGPVSFRLSKKAENDALKAEAVRKLYVAVTRHRDHLVLIGADWRDNDGQFKESGCYMRMLDETLGISNALDAGDERIRCGDGFYALLRRVAPSGPPRRRRAMPIGSRIVSAAGEPGEIVRAFAEAGRDEDSQPPLMTPAAGAAPTGTMAATALTDLAYCPMLYRWRHELRVPGEAPIGHDDGTQPETRLDAAAEGTLLHRCMELYVASLARAGQAGDPATLAEGLLNRAAAQMGIWVPPLTEQLAGMLDRLQAGPLMRALSGAKDRLAELPLAYRVGSVDITGQIDLLFQDAGGLWHVVDYKSDRIGPGDVSRRARRYELQMMIYLLAAGQTLETSLADATVWFLRPGASHRFDATPESLAAARLRLEELIEGLARCRSSGQFPGIGDTEISLCNSCPYAGLCVQ